MIASVDIHANIGEFQRQYIYKLFIENLPPAITTTFPDAAQFQSNVDLYNTKAVFPNRKTANITVKWGGEFFDIPGVDESERNTELQFFEDEPMWVYDFFSALKDYTGNEYNQAGVWGIEGKFDMGIAMISVDKETIRVYRRLSGVRVYSIEADEADREADGISHLKIGIRWDRNIEDKTKRGTKV